MKWLVLVRYVGNGGGVRGASAPPLGATFALKYLREFQGRRQNLFKVGGRCLHILYIYIYICIKKTIHDILWYIQRLIRYIIIYRCPEDFNTSQCTVQTFLLDLAKPSKFLFIDSVYDKVWNGFYFSIYGYAHVYMSL